MILVDASVWIDFFRNRSTPQVELLVTLFDGKSLAVGDLTVTEVLQGFDQELAAARAARRLAAFPFLDLAGSVIAVQAARNYRFLRARGITVRKTIDTFLATRCIVDDHALLFSDRDFDPFVAHLGLRSALTEAEV